MDGKLWNIGIRVADVEKEVSYFKALGAVLRVQEKLATKDGQFEYALLDFGGTRLFLTPKTVFEHALPESLRDGVTHAVFEVKDVEATLKETCDPGNRSSHCAHGDRCRARLAAARLLPFAGWCRVRNHADPRKPGIGKPTWHSGEMPLAN